MSRDIDGFSHSGRIVVLVLLAVGIPVVVVVLLVLVVVVVIVVIVVAIVIVVTVVETLRIVTCDTTKEGLDWCQLLMCILLQPSTCNTG